jgi:hypothetical protein
MGRTHFFVLDRPHPTSLTLRDYSKVVAGHKQSFVALNQGRVTKQKLSKDKVIKEKIP